jgi:hypothetical protein
LDRTRGFDQEEGPSAILDAKNIALEGATERFRLGQKNLLKLLSAGGPVTSKSGEMIEIPTIPPLPIKGMDQAEGLDAIWRTAAHESGFKWLSAIAPGILGLLEKALPDAAHAKQRAERDLSDAKKRGGSGGQKAEKAGTKQPPVEHLTIWPPKEDDDASGSIDPETLAGDVQTPQEQVEALEEKTQAQRAAEAAMRIAVKRWGEGGRRMLEALRSGETDKQAAKAAGISGPALIKRRDTLRKLLENM